MLRSNRDKEYKIKLIEQFYKENRRLPKRKEKAPDGTEIGVFLTSIKIGQTKITEKQLERLEKLGFSMKIIDREYEKERKIKLIEQFYKENGRLPKQKEKAPDGTEIGVFLNYIKAGDIKITEKQLERLEKLGFFMKPKEYEKERKIRLVEQFYKENGRLPKQKEKAPDGTEIGVFLTSIKIGQTKITEKQLERLEKLGFSMKIIDREYEKERKIKLIEQFYKENGRLPKQKEKAPDGTAIGTFLKSIKQGASRITDNQYKRLQKIGFVMDSKLSKSDLINMLKKERDSLIELKEKSSVLIKK